ncbi:MAG TPA: VOC family protein [Acidimicrobiales bacterium]|nr:VOC family protein [Acidimicrobiales bacterium]
MAAQLNHLIVRARDKEASARFLAGILGIPVGAQWGPFVPVQVGEVTVDFEDATEIQPMHLAFLVTEDEFEAAYARLQEGGTPIYADPFRSRPGEINHLYGGRGVYFDDPDGHFFELITRPYGSSPEG